MSNNKRKTTVSSSKEAVIISDLKQISPSTTNKSKSAHVKVRKAPKPNASKLEADLLKLSCEEQEDILRRVKNQRTLLDASVENVLDDRSPTLLEELELDQLRYELGDILQKQVDLRAREKKVKLAIKKKQRCIILAHQTMPVESVLPTNVSSHYVGPGDCIVLDDDDHDTMEHHKWKQEDPSKNNLLPEAILLKIFDTTVDLPKLAQCPVPTASTSTSSAKFLWDLSKDIDIGETLDRRVKEDRDCVLMPSKATILTTPLKYQQQQEICRLLALSRQSVDIKGAENKPFSSIHLENSTCISKESIYESDGNFIESSLTADLTDEDINKWQEECQKRLLVLLSESTAENTLSVNSSDLKLPLSLQHIKQLFQDVWTANHMLISNRCEFMDRKKTIDVLVSQIEVHMAMICGRDMNTPEPVALHSLYLDILFLQVIIKECLMSSDDGCDNFNVENHYKCERSNKMDRDAATTTAVTANKQRVDVINLDDDFDDDSNSFKSINNDLLHIPNVVELTNNGTIGVDLVNLVGSTSTSATGCLQKQYATKVNMVTELPRDSSTFNISVKEKESDSLPTITSYDSSYVTSSPMLPLFERLKKIKNRFNQPSQLDSSHKESHQSVNSHGATDYCGIESNISDNKRKRDNIDVTSSFDRSKRLCQSNQNNYNNNNNMIMLDDNSLSRIENADHVCAEYGLTMLPALRQQPSLVQSLVTRIAEDTSSTKSKISTKRKIPESKISKKSSTVQDGEKDSNRIERTFEEQALDTIVFFLQHPSQEILYQRILCYDVIEIEDVIQAAQIFWFQHRTFPSVDATTSADNITNTNEKICEHFMSFFTVDLVRKALDNLHVFYKPPTKNPSRGHSKASKNVSSAKRKL